MSKIEIKKKKNLSIEEVLNSVCSQTKDEACFSSSTPTETQISATQSSGSQISGITPLNKTAILEEEEEEDHFEIKLKTKKPHSLKKKTAIGFKHDSSSSQKIKRKDHSCYSLSTITKEKKYCVAEDDDSNNDEEYQNCAAESSIDYSLSLSDSDKENVESKDKSKMTFLNKNQTVIVFI